MQDRTPGFDIARRLLSDVARRRMAAWLASLLIVVGVLIDLVTPSHYTPSAIFTAAPLIVAPVLSLTATAVTGVVASLALLACLFFAGAPAFSEAVTQEATVIIVSALAVGFNVLIRRGARQLASARDVAEAAQRAVLPTPPARIGDLEIAARYAAADVDARIGGDLYAVQETPYGTRLIVGDVRGKGMGSVAAVAIVLGAFREAAQEEGSLREVAARLDRALRREAGRWRGPERIEEFTTAALAEFPDDRSSRVRFVNRGHPPPLLFTGTTVGYVEPSVPALPLGLGELGPQWHVPVDETCCPAGGQLLFYTDGLSESRDGRGRFYDPLRRLSAHRFTGPDAMLDAVLDDVSSFTRGGTADDMALLAVGRRGAVI